VGDAEPLGYTADDCRVRLYNVGCTSPEQFLKSKSGRFHFAGRHGVGERVVDLSHQADTVRTGRFLDEVRVVLRERPAKPEGVCLVLPGMVGVKEEEAGSECFARDADPFDLFFERPQPDLDLDHVVTALDVRRHFVTEAVQPLVGEIVPTAGVGRHLVVSGTEELVEGEVDRLRSEIPQRDVDRRYPPEERAPSSDPERVVVHFLPQSFDIVRILTLDHWGQ